MDPQPVFYYDLGSPQCYIVGETIMSTLPVVPEWEPVLASQITGSEQQADPDREEVERLAAALGLQALRWPRNWPPDTTTAMLAATYAKKVGRGVAFSLAAFRQEFAGGRDIGDENTVLIAGAACEMHPVALTNGHRAAIDRTGTPNRRRASRQRRCAVPAGDPDGRPHIRRSRGVGSGGRAMRANRLYHLIVSREGREPAFLSDPNRTDRIEVVSVDDGEVILYWNVDPKQASRLVKLLRADLASLDAEEFFDKWLDADAEDD